MCFSATASFTTSALLSLIGLLSIGIARTTFHRLLACTPLFFAIQQFFEGILWLYLPEHSWITEVSSYGFLFFALIFWPLWIPFVLRAYEPNKARKAIISSCLFAGALLAVCFTGSLIYYGAQAFVVKCHIYYHHTPLTMPLFILLATVLYLWATIVPFFVTSKSYLWTLGLAIAIAYLISLLWYTLVLTSVWCFFAAVISGMVGCIIYRYNQIIP